MRLRRLLPLAAALLLGACTTVGPDYASPAGTAPSQVPFMEANSPAFMDTPTPSAWWTLYRDSVLDRLVTEALIANKDLLVAEANLREARAALRETRTQRLPSTAVGGGATTNRVQGEPAESYDVGFDASYQVDLFGAVRRAVERSTASAEAVAAARDLTAITVAAETARAYAGACAAGNQLAVARRSLEVQQQTQRLTQQRRDGGIGTGLDVASTAALVEQTRATLPTLEADRRANLYALARLTGRPPAEFPRDVAACAVSPRLTDPIPVGEGAGLLARRPDIRQAERRLAAATADVGVATAQLYPTVSLGLSVGSTAASLGDLGSDGGFRYSLGPLISWTFPNTTVARARIAQAQARGDASLAAFDGTWLGALQETETALTRYANELDRNAALVAALGRSGDAARLARLRYRAGADSYLTVLDADRTLAQAEIAKAQSDALITGNQISVFLALGGGWEVAPITRSAATAD